MALPAGLPEMGRFQGNGIADATTRYAASSSGTAAPSSGWSTSIPNVQDGQYLWTRVTLTMDDASTSVAYSVTRRGSQGPPVDEETLAAAVEDSLASTGRLSDVGVPVGGANPVTDLDELPAASGWFRAFSTALHRPPGGFTWSVLQLVYSASAAVQIAVPVTTSATTGLWVRTKRDGAFEAWQKLPTGADVDTRVGGLVTELNLVSDYTVGTGQTVTDLDAFDPPRSAIVRALSSAANRPAGTNGFMVTHMRTNANSAVQFAVESGDGRAVYTRVKSSGTWSGWLRIVDQIGLAAVDASIRADQPAVIDQRLVDRDAILGPDDRAMRHGVPFGWRVVDVLGKIALAVSRTGRVFAPDFEARRAALAGMSFEESPTGDLHVKDRAGKVAFRIGRDGRTFIGDLDPRSHVVLDSTRINRVVVLWKNGQSNAAGRAKPIGPRLDVPHPRILMAQWTDTVVTGLGVASVPVSSQSVGDRSGLDPATDIARRIVAEQPDTAVVICDAAKGGSAVVLDTSNGVWGVGYTGANRWLLPISKAALTATLAQIATAYPGVPVDVQLVWHQGESDEAQTYEVYKPALRGVFEDLRAHAGDPTMPIVMGGTVPEASNPTEEANIMAAQIALQGEMQYIAFTPGIPNGGGSNAPSGDTVHYHRDGMERLGANMHKALRRAYANTTTSNPLPPLDVTARWRKTAGVLEIGWSFPTCRATAFLVQYRIDGGAWQSVSGRPRELDPVATVTGLTTGGELEVRVATVNDVGTSAYTTPIIAIGA